MKATIMNTVTVGMTIAALSGFALLPVSADDAAAPAKEAPDTVAANTTTLYIVQVTGKG
ncbi:MAG: hypothetical protein H7A51_05355 [Akkermansiaceae bacterium]|nr:hypothetical protein [Akkermansiaceae bacterium]